MDDDRNIPQADGDLAALSTAHSFEPGAERCFKCGAAIEWVDDNPHAPCLDGVSLPADIHDAIDVRALVAELQRVRMGASALTDLALYGTRFVKDGERIDPRDVVFVPDSTVSNGTRVTVGGSGDGQFRITHTREPTGYIEAEPRSLFEQLEQFERLDPDVAEQREFARRFMGIDHAAAEKPSQTVWVDRERFVWASANNLEPMKIVEWSGEPKADEWRSLKPGDWIWIDDTCGSVVVTDLPADEHRADEVWLPEPDDRPEQVAAALTSWLDIATEKGWPADEKVLQGLVDAVERYRCYRGGART